MLPDGKPNYYAILGVTKSVTGKISGSVDLAIQPSYYSARKTHHFHMDSIFL